MREDMIDKPLLYCLLKLLAVVATIIMNYSANVDITTMVISTLSFACVFLAEILFDRLLHNNKLIIVTLLITIIACFMLDSSLYLPVFLIATAHLLELSINSTMYYYILAVSAVLSIFILTPDKQQVVISAILVGMLLLCKIIIEKLHLYNQMYIDQKETISQLNKKMKDLRGLTKTLKYTVSAEERNRIAARIHDQIGHGISGSIIMLEAAMLVMKEHPDKATDSIQKAINNLREGVDEIRAALREERVDRYLLGINDITAMLEEFKVSYNKEAILKTSGDLDFITLEIWTCIHDNLKECLTNVLKHSNATEFIISIEVFKKIIKVEYKDNGRSSEGFEKGIGLDAIEERTINAKGRCFFQKSEKGFSITNIFTY